MKKFLFILTLLTALMLGGVALAINCDTCGSGNTSLQGTGAWCHWLCNDCGAQTSRNHNPNSAMSGLVPDSCSGTCQWCGAPANWSSHTFGEYVSNGDATCLEDGTETCRCTNVQCSASITQQDVGSALGHQYYDRVIPPTCEKGGYTDRTCIRCWFSYADFLTDPLGHDFGAWHTNHDGTHSASCTRTGCGAGTTEDCRPVTITLNGQTLTYCPLCGAILAEEGTPALEPSEGAAVEALDGQELPGKLVVLVDAAPLEVALNPDALYLILASFQQAEGTVVDCGGRVKLTIDLNQHPFSVAEGAFAGLLPAALSADGLRFVRVETALANGEAVEVWEELPFTLTDGILTFETSMLGTFLLLPAEAEAPSVG